MFDRKVPLKLHSSRRHSENKEICLKDVWFFFNAFSSRSYNTTSAYWRWGWAHRGTKSLFIFCH